MQTNKPTPTVLSRNMYLRIRDPRARHLLDRFARGERMLYHDRMSLPWARAVAISPSMDLQPTDLYACDILRKDINRWKQERDLAIAATPEPLFSALQRYLTRGFSATHACRDSKVSREELFNCLVSMSQKIYLPVE